MVLNDVTTLPVSTERRSRRGETLSQAIGFQIEQVIQDFDLATCVIATHDGLLLSAPDSLLPRQAHLLAAIAPEVLSGRFTQHGAREFLAQTCGDEEVGADALLHAQEFWLCGQPMVMLTLGAHGPEHELSSCRAILGVRRIAREFEPVPASF